jgi:uncharacterized protein (DUF1015 family)
VTLLHEVVLRGILGIDVAQSAGHRLSFGHDAREALARVRRGEVQVAFLMNPTRVEALRAVAGARCTMPQKATYFYPKLLSGLLIHALDEGVET